MREQHWGYRILRTIVLALSSLLFRVRVQGRRNVPPRGPYVIAPSHRSAVDIVFAAYVTKRRIRFMAKKEWWEHKLAARLFEALGTFPVDRDGADRQALKAALGALADGEPVAIFPEGTRRSGPVLGELAEGVAYVALKAGVPIVPVGIGGGEEILPSGVTRPRLHRGAVVVGAPIVVDQVAGTVKRSQMGEVTKELRDRLQAAFDAAQVLAGN
ncbi:MAG: lysophospholipid acyltransferase family protein [Acidimicrobiia bacterium]